MFLDFLCSVTSRKLYGDCLALQVNMQALKNSCNRELAAKEDDLEEQRHMMQKQLRELESEMEEERKMRTAAVTVRRKLESDLRGLEADCEMATMAKEDAVKQMKKYQVGMLKVVSLLY